MGGNGARHACQSAAAGSETARSRVAKAASRPPPSTRGTYVARCRERAVDVKENENILGHGGKGGSGGGGRRAKPNASARLGRASVATWVSSPAPPFSSFPLTPPRGTTLCPFPALEPSRSAVHVLQRLGAEPRVFRARSVPTSQLCVGSRALPARERPLSSLPR